VDAAVEDVLGQGGERTTADEAPGEVGEAAAPEPGRSRGDRALLAGLLVAVNLPVLVATVRALAGGWQPMGDNGIMLVRARDVGTGHNPLLGMWTSASALFDADLNHPGPLYFDALALPVRVLGPWVGLAVGAMLVNMAASSFAVVAGRRISGTDSMVAVAVVVVAMQFAMGSELLFDVWQPNALVLPFVAFLVAAAAVASGDVAMAPWMIGIGSLVVQTHISHAVLVTVLVLVSGGLCAWAVRRAGEPVAWRRPVVVAVVVGLVAWAQPLIEQFTSEGDGNMTRILDASSVGGATPIGWDRAPRLMAEIMARGPWFTRDSYGRAIPPIAADEPATGAVTFGPAVAVLVALAAVLLVVGVVSTRRGRRGVASLAWVALAAMGTALVVLATSPVNAAGISVHQMRWLWPIAAVVTAALAAALALLVRSRPRLHGGLLALGCLTAAVVAGFNVPTFLSDSKGPTESAPLLDDALELVGGVEALEGRGTVLYDDSGLLFAEPFSGMTFAEMQDRGIPFVVENEGLIRQFGESRRDDGTADLRLWQVQGDDARDVPPGVVRLSYVETDVGPVALFAEPLD
jgi:hypothetical protein